MKKKSVSLGIGNGSFQRLSSKFYDSKYGFNCDSFPHGEGELSTEPSAFTCAAGERSDRPSEHC